MISKFLLSNRLTKMPEDLTIDAGTLDEVFFPEYHSLLVFYPRKNVLENGDLISFCLTPITNCKQAVTFL